MAWCNGYLGDADRIGGLFEVLRPVLTARMRRLVAAAEAQALGRGGVTLVARATGVARSTSGQGIKELAAPLAAAPRQRRPGGGRKPLTAHDPTLLCDLEALVEPLTRGDPQSPLRWTCKRLSQLAAALAGQGHQISARKVGDLLRALDYSLPANRTIKAGASHPDRNAQFEYVNAQVQAFQQRGHPVIAVDAKKQDLVGECKHGGREWQPAGQPEAVRVHDCPAKTLGKAIPDGVYAVGANQGWVSVGTDHDTAAFAVETVRQWWQQMGAPRYPTATDLLILADGGGSNSRRARLWKVAVQRFADATGLRVHVCHFPPGTSKWNKLEHGMFCHITRNWRGRPLVSHDVIVNLIGSTTTQTGVRIRAALDCAPYPTKQHVSDADLARGHRHPDGFHGEWNYTIHQGPPVT